MVDKLDEVFSRLSSGNYQISSAATKRYNCIAWVAGDDRNWWWPAPAARNFWPAGLPRFETIQAFEQAFASLGYVVCESGHPEPSVEKIAFFADSRNIPTHAARQLPGRRWTSKLGEREDIEHDLHDLEGELYGTVVRFMKRSRSEKPTTETSV